MYHYARRLARKTGVTRTVKSLYRRINPPRIVSFDSLKSVFSGKLGLEIGGPSSRFEGSGIIPVYPLARRIDNCNFSSQTVWEGALTEGRTFRFHPRKEPGNQVTAEATDLSHLDDAVYDFVLSAHTLEHTANPLKALSEWLRVLVPGGVLVIVLPHRDGTFDHKRPISTLDHLIADFEGETREDDLTHLDEILALHDLSRDRLAGTFEEFRERSSHNIVNRCLHHHVFDVKLAVSVIDHIGMQILYVEGRQPQDIIVIARKVVPNESFNNTAFLTNAPKVWESPFPSDNPLA